MKRSERRALEESIRLACEQDTPDVLARVMDTCATAAQLPPLPAQADIRAARKRPSPRPILRRVAALALCLMLLLSGTLVGMLLPDLGGDPPAAVADTFVYLDVNPSIELRVDNAERVLACLAGNADAERILSGLVLDGVDLHTALTAIIGSMYVNGYLTDGTNAILVSVDGPTVEVEDGLLGAISGRINAVLENSSLTCSIIAQAVEVNDAIREEAAQHGVSVGKMQLVRRMTEADEELGDVDLAELSDMSIRELSLMYESSKAKDEEGRFDRDVTTGRVDGYMDVTAALDAALGMLDIDLDGIGQSSVKVGYTGKGDERRMVYRVSCEIGFLRYRVTVDCSTGEVLSSEVDYGGEGEDLPPHGDISSPSGQAPGQEVPSPPTEPTEPGAPDVSSQDAPHNGDHGAPDRAH